jgi:hypothetical protein
VENRSGKPGRAAARYVTCRSAAPKERRCAMLGWTAVVATVSDIFGNYAGNQGQCRLKPPFPDLHGKQACLTDLMGTEIYDRDGTDLVDNGLFIDHGPWHYNVHKFRTI